MSEIVVVYASNPDNSNELIGFKVYGSEILIVGISHTDEYKEILLSHNVELYDNENELLMGDLSRVNDVSELLSECRDHFRDLGFKCSHISTKTQDEWMDEIKNEYNR